MDPILQQLLEEGGKTVLATTLGACLAKLLRSKKKKQLTPKEEAQVQKTAEKMIHLATMEDVRLYSPTYQAVWGMVRRGGAARKKAAPKRAAKKAASKAIRRSVSKKR